MEFRPTGSLTRGSALWPSASESRLMATSRCLRQTLPLAACRGAALLHTPTSLTPRLAHSPSRFGNRINSKRGGVFATKTEVVRGACRLCSCRLPPAAAACAVHALSSGCAYASADHGLAGTASAPGRQRCSEPATSIAALTSRSLPACTCLPAGASLKLVGPKGPVSAAGLYFKNSECTGCTGPGLAP